MYTCNGNNRKQSKSAAEVQVPPTLQVSKRTALDHCYRVRAFTFPRNSFNVLDCRAGPSCSKGGYCYPPDKSLSSG